MTAWMEDELAKMGRAEEIEIAVRRADGRIGNRVTVWAVALGDALYVRSAVKGRDAAWFRAMLETHEGRVWAGGVERPVRFEDANHDLDDQIDAAYRTKYRRYSGRILNTVLTRDARATTVSVVPGSASP